MSGTGNRCVTRALWDLQAAATRARAADPAAVDAALRCEPTFTRFLCESAYSPPGDPFTCEVLDADPTGTARPEVDDDADGMDMDGCVWPVCEALCVGRPTDSKRTLDRNAEQNKQTCGRCAAACQGRPGATSAGFPGERKGGGRGVV